MKKETNVGISYETKIEVVAINNNGVAIKKEMLYKEFLSLKKKKGYQYLAYELGFSQFNN
jgi:hypothetical protein